MSDWVSRYARSDGIGLSGEEAEGRASIAQCICERCYRSALACAQPLSGPALAASHGSALYCTGTAYTMQWSSCPDHTN